MPLARRTTGTLGCTASMVLALGVCRVARADTVVVTGVVVLGTESQRAGGQTVQLFALAGTKGLVAADQTSARGVYAFVMENVGPEVGELWVTISSAEFASSPVRVGLQPFRQGARRGLADDLVLRPKKPVGALSRHDAVELLAALTNEEALRVGAGVTTSKSAQNAVTAYAELVIGRVDKKAVSKASLDALLKAVDGRLDKNVAAFGALDRDAVRRVANKPELWHDEDR